MAVDAMLLDIDGTLVDNNPLHVLAWQRALRRVGREVHGNEILHRIGMGGDQFAPAILGPGTPGEQIEAVRRYHDEEYTERGLVEHTAPLPGAADLLRALRGRGVRVALASSASQEEVEHYLGLLDGAEAVDAIVTGKDVAATKPEPDIFARALERLGRPARALVLGDTIYDIQAAAKLGLPCVALRSGGIEDQVLRDAGAVRVYDNAGAVLADLDRVLALR